MISWPLFLRDALQGHVSWTLANATCEKKNTNNVFVEEIIARSCTYLYIWSSLEQRPLSMHLTIYNLKSILRWTLKQIMRWIYKMIIMRWNLGQLILWQNLNIFSWILKWLLKQFLRKMEHNPMMNAKTIKLTPILRPILRTFKWFLRWFRK